MNAESEFGKAQLSPNAEIRHRQHRSQATNKYRDMRFEYLSDKQQGNMKNAREQGVAYGDGQFIEIGTIGIMNFEDLAGRTQRSAVKDYVWHNLHDHPNDFEPETNEDHVRTSWTIRMEEAQGCSFLIKLRKNIEVVEKSWT